MPKRAAPDFTPADHRFMRRALALAERGRGRVEPNPMVGCVLVRGGKIVAEGWHRRYGGPHAEVDALRRLNGSSRGLTAYVTLEPCCHFGKTPPCTNALIDAGVARVVAAMIDPGPHVAGKGLRQLRAAGVSVELGLCEPESTHLNAAYVKLTQQQRPWVILKWAQTLDGRIATRSGDSKWISGPAARRDAHRTRGLVDAIAIGVETLLADDPLLTARDAPARRTALRIVFDTHLRTPPDCRLVRSARATPTRIYCGPRPTATRRRKLEAAGCEVREAQWRDGQLDPSGVLDDLGRERRTRLLVEGGGRLLGSFAAAGLADEVHIYLAPLILADERARAALTGLEVERVAEGLSLIAPQWRRLGADWRVTARLARPG